MATSWACPYCHQKAKPNTEAAVLFLYDRTVRAIMIRIDCPNPDCRKESLRVRLEEWQFNRDSAEYRPGNLIDFWSLLPQSRARPWPAYIPGSIVDDYTEACLIENLSPKASATLSRRCLQAILRDFFGVPRKRNLAEEIDAVTGIEPDVAQALHALREVGAVGAHPADEPTIIVDVEPEEATVMIDLLEILIDETYVARAKRAETIAKTQAIAARVVTAKKAAVAGSTQTALPAPTKTP